MNVVVTTAKRMMSDTVRRAAISGSVSAISKKATRARRTAEAMQLMNVDRKTCIFSLNAEGRWREQ